LQRSAKRRTPSARFSGCALRTVVKMFDEAYTELTQSLHRAYTEKNVNEDSPNGKGPPRTNATRAQFGRERHPSDRGCRNGIEKKPSSRPVRRSVRGCYRTKLNMETRRRIKTPKEAGNKNNAAAEQLLERKKVATTSRKPRGDAYEQTIRRVIAAKHFKD